MKGIVYIIRPKIEHDPSHVYYGSTIRDNRYNEHKRDYEKWMTNKSEDYVSSFKVFMKYGFDNCEFVVLKEFDDISLSELRASEYSYIIKNPCVNTMLNSVTQNENAKDYIEKMNLQITKEVSAKKKTGANLRYELDETFRDKAKKITKEKFDANPHLSENRACDCGGRYSIRNLKQHLQTNRHQRFHQRIPV
jgi:hypothetical protein